MNPEGVSASDRAWYRKAPAIHAHPWFPVTLSALLLVLLYAPTFRIGFLGDDFAWLSIRQNISDATSAMENLFIPRAQGTVRLFSERLFFLVPSLLWPGNPVPLRIVVFLTQGLILLSLASIARRLGTPPLAILITLLLWLVNPGVAVTMSWLTTYNQLLLTALLLLAFACFLSRRRAFCWLFFLLGFGALESVIVFPLILLAYTLLLDRSRVREAIPFLVPSVLFVLLRLLFIPQSSSATYQFHFGPQLGTGLWTYWKTQLSFDILARHREKWRFLLPWAPIAATVVLAVAFALQTRAKNYVPLFFLICWLCLLTPVLPLTDHHSDYYVASPGLAFALMAGSLFRLPAGVPKAVPAATGLLAAGLFLSGWQAARDTASWYRGRADAVDRVIRAVVSTHRTHPGKLILLRGVDDFLFGFGIAHAPFRLHGVEEVFIHPADPILNRVTETRPFAFDSQSAVAMARTGRAVVLQITPGQVREVTEESAANPPLQDKGGLLCATIRFDSHHCADQLGDGWYAPEAGTRWIGARATVALAKTAPAAPALRIEAWIPDQLLDSGTVTLTVLSTGRRVGSTELRQAGMQSLRIPLRLPLAPTAPLEISLSKTILVPPDKRPLSLLVSRIGLEEPPPPVVH